MAKEFKKLHNAFTEEHYEIIRKLYADTPNKVIANVAQTIINSASVENQYLKIVGGSHCSKFIEEGRMENIKSIAEKN